MIVHPKKMELLQEIKYVNNFKENPNALQMYKTQID